MNPSTGGRKFVLVMTALFVSAGLVLAGKMTDGVFAGLLGPVIAAYLGANVWQKKGTGNEPLESNR